MRRVVDHCRDWKVLRWTKVRRHMIEAPKFSAVLSQRFVMSNIGKKQEVLVAFTVCG